MKKIIALAAAALCAASIAVPVATTPATAQSFSFSFGDGPSYYQRWERPRYFGPRYYTPRYRAPGVRVDIGPFSFRARGDLGHVARCEARFQSYDRYSDTYMGYDGERHRCRL